MDASSSAAQDVEYRLFKPSDLPLVVELVSAELSEPYVRSTFHYFLSSKGWPHLCFLAFNASKEHVGAIVCKQERHRRQRMRGYIAMLSVRKDHRRRGIARRLIRLVIDLMRANEVDEIVLEAEEDNHAALALYESLGFFRLKALYRFYFSGQNAVRLMLPLTLRQDSPYQGLSLLESDDDAHLADLYT